MNYRLKYTLFTIAISLSWIINSQSNMRITGKLDKQRVSFNFSNNLIVIPVELNGKKLSFILDSGASKTIIFGIAKNDSLTLHNSKKVQLRGLGSDKAIEGIISKGNIIKINNILGLNQTIYVILDSKFDLSLRMGQTIHGIIGYDLLKNFITKIDYKRKKIIFYKPSEFFQPNSKKFKSFPLEFHHKKPYINTFINISGNTNKLGKLLIDTGNSDALWLFEDKKSGIMIHNKYFEDHIGEGLSGSIHGKRSKIYSFSIGNFTFKQPTTAFLDSTTTIFARSYISRNGSIGSKLLKRFSVILDYPNQKIYLKKVKNFDKEFRYDRAGIKLAHIGKILVREQKLNVANILGVQDIDKNNSVFFDIDYNFKFKPIYCIYQIRPNSPAEKAGLQTNDIISKINGKPAYEYTLKELRSLFYGKEGTKIKLLIERRGALFYYEFVLKKPL